MKKNLFWVVTILIFSIFFYYYTFVGLKLDSLSASEIHDRAKILLSFVAAYFSIALQVYNRMFENKQFINLQCEINDIGESLALGVSIYHNFPAIITLESIECPGYFIAPAQTIRPGEEVKQRYELESVKIWRLIQLYHFHFKFIALNFTYSYLGETYTISAKAYNIKWPGSLPRSLSRFLRALKGADHA